VRFNDTFLNRLKTSDQVPDILTELVPDMKRSGSNGSFIGRVPWREDEHPSLNIFRGRDNAWMFKDMAQDDSGDSINLVMRVTGQDFTQAVEWLAGRLGISLPNERSEPNSEPLAAIDERLKALQRFYELAKPLEDGTTPAEYLRNRGLLESARLSGVRGYEPDEPKEILGKGYRLGLATPERWVREGYGFLVYPATINGKIIAHRCRLLMGQSEAVSVGFRAAHWTPTTRDGLTLPAIWPMLPETLPDKIVLTEGESDALAVRTLVSGTQAYAILGTGGLNQQSAEFQRIAKTKPKITLAFQRDSASAKKAKKLLDLFKRHGVTCKAIVPAGGANDWAQLIEWGTSTAESLDEIAAPLGDYSIPQTFDALGKHLADMEAGRVQMVPVPWATLSWAFNDTGIPPKTIGLLSSKTGVGKTWFTFQFALFVAGYKLSQSLATFICNSEMTEASTAARLLALASGNANAVSMSDTELIRELQFEYQDALDKLPLEITPPEPRSTDDVIDLLTEKARTHKLLIVDHIGDLSFAGKSWEILPAFTLKLRDLARRTGTTIMLVTHLKTGEAGMDILSYSKQIENVVDWSWSLQGFEPCTATVATACGNIEETINRTVTIRKNRFGHSGIRIAMNFDEKTLALKDLGRMVKMATKRS